LGACNLLPYANFALRARGIPVTRNLMAVGAAGALAAIVIGINFLPLTKDLGLWMPRETAERLLAEMQDDLKDGAGAISFLETGRDAFQADFRRVPDSYRTKEGFIAPTFVVSRGSMRLRTAFVTQEKRALHLWKAGITKINALRFVRQQVQADSRALATGLRAPILRNVGDALPAVRDLLCLGTLMVFFVQIYLLSLRWATQLRSPNEAWLK